MKIALALACSSLFACGSSLTREEVLSPAAAAELGSRVRIHGYEHAGESYSFPGTIDHDTLRTSSGVEQTLDPEDQVRATVTYRAGDVVPDAGVVENEFDAGMIVVGSLLLAGGGAALGSGIAIASSCHESSTPFSILSGCAGQILGGFGLGLLGATSMLVGFPVLLVAANGRAVIKKRPTLHVSISPAALTLGGTF
jgi:hypothetical protein